MTLHALHDAATVARLAGAPCPECESLALSTENPSEVLFAFVGSNPLAPDWLVDLDLPGERIACWSGTLDPDAATSGDLFRAHPHNWMQPGGEALARLLDEITPGLERHGRRLCLVPHARHVLNDVQGSINLIRERAGSPIEVALAPASLLTPSMLGTLEDHLARCFETLAEHAPFLFLHDVQVDVEDDRLLPTPLGEGILDQEIVRRMIDRHWPEDRPIVIPAGDLAAQGAWLSGS
ncbi:MAG: hypothetical protein MK082_08565 [Phycisphaerales bacterium]|nr:hypothetical protein [Phycisphaerales bacterium]